MGLPFHTAQDARNKLNRTIIMYKDEPYYCEYVANNVYALFDLATKKCVMDVDYTSDHFNYMCIDLGYMQAGPDAVYVTRSPMRQVRQALGFESVAHCLVDNHLFWSSSMKQCILGNHSLFSAALKDVMSHQRRGAPFHRHFAVNRDKSIRGLITLEHMGSTIGYQVDKSLDTFRLYDTGYTEYLKADLENMGVKLC